MLVPATAVANPLSPQEHTVAHVFTTAPFSFDPLVLPVLAHRIVKGREWLRVRLAGRPNGSKGWIPKSSSQHVTIRWSIGVDLSQRALTVHRYRRDGSIELTRRMRVVIGAPSTPTPTGRFFVVDRTRLQTSWSATGWALALSAYSNVLMHFDGGEGELAIHARGSLTGDLGSMSSHGCVRVPDWNAAWLARWVPNGTSVTIAP
jgi:lipoprotein-anchoring transpeptidase ErfK/SrfK